MELKENFNNIVWENTIDELDEKITKELWHILNVRELLRVLETYDKYQNPEYTNYNDNEKLFLRKLYKKFPDILYWNKEFIRKIKRYLKSLPKNLVLDDIIESIKYNIEYDFSKLLNKFQLKNLKIEISDDCLHPSTCNQIRITYTAAVNFNNPNFFLACFDCFFVHENGKKRLIIQDIQWEIKNPTFDTNGKNISLDEKKQQRFKHKMYGKLSKELGCNDRWNGIIERIKELGKEENMETIGLIPPCFSLVGNRETHYVNYRFKYLYYFTYNELKIENWNQYEKFAIPFNEILKIIDKRDKEQKLAIISSFRENLLKFRHSHDLNNTNYLVNLFEVILHQIRDTQDIEYIQNVIQKESEKLENLITKKSVNNSINEDSTH